MPGGCLPWETCASCNGSPSKTMLGAARAQAIASAIESCPASSTTSTSNALAAPSSAKKNGVPETMPVAGRERALRVRLVCYVRAGAESRLVPVLIVGVLMRAFKTVAAVVGRGLYGRDEIVRRLVAARENGDALSGFEQLDDGRSSGRALTGARRPLHDEIAAIERRDRRGERRAVDLVGLNARAGGTARQAREAVEHHIDDRRIVRCQSAVEVSLGNVDQGFLLRPARKRLGHEGA